jgi:hypothetical protein
MSFHCPRMPAVRPCHCPRIARPRQALASYRSVSSSNNFRPPSRISSLCHANRTPIVNIDLSRNWRCRLRRDYHVGNAMRSVFNTSGPELATPSSPRLPPSARTTFSPLDILPAARTNPVNLFRILRNPAARRRSVYRYHSPPPQASLFHIQVTSTIAFQGVLIQLGCGSLLYINAVSFTALVRGAIISLTISRSLALSWFLTFPVSMVCGYCLRAIF